MGVLQRVFRRIAPGAVVSWNDRRQHVADMYRAYFQTRVEAIGPTVRATGEFSNFTYDLTDKSLRYLAEMIAVATKAPVAEVEGYITEAINDRDMAAATASPWAQSPFGRRLGWYAIARITKPKVIVETGVERGHGSIIMCAALLRNAAEGSPGRYFGTDIDPSAGVFLRGKYATVGTILVGDSITSLAAMQEEIGLFINDSDHSAEYEYREYQAIKGKLAPGAFVLGDNAHVSDKLALFSREEGRRFLFFREEPKGHWYPGAGIGISFPP